MEKMWKSTKMKQARRVFNYIDPLFMYIPLVFYLSKVYQWTTDDNISVWQALWDRIQLIFGDYKMFDNRVCGRETMCGGK